jgi:crotonobetainyl-CoA:carnitine CoA-transferase CaiB-like acyl-CoA transferase
VLDLSSLWAGPLCSHLLELMGADVVKLESRQRPDGARRGHAGFFDLLNQRKRSVMLDFASAEGRAQLAQLIAAADIVIEASRPRALRQLGIDAEVLCARHEHLSWIGITGYGRREPQAQWIAFGDDAGVAAGLSSALHAATGQWAFVGDAIGDPITGLHAALYAWAGWQRGGAGIVDIALVGALQSCAVFESQEPKERGLDWTSALANRQRETWPPAQRTADVPAPALGEHTHEVLSEWLA